jgi:gluconolactonase
LTRSDLKGKTETLAETFDGKKLNGPHDVVVRRDGHVYFIDPAFGTAVDQRELGYYGIFHLGLKREFDAIARWQTRPGGITLSADGRTLYVTDADRHAMVAFDVGRNGEVDKPRDVLRNIAGVPGGIRTDADGRYYIAARGIAVYTSAGKLERTLMDSTNCTNCTFGEGDLEYLFAASRGDIYRIKMGVKGALQY